MLNGRSDTYAMWESKTTPAPPGNGSGAFLIDPKNAHHLNLLGYGIFETINQYNGKRRFKDNVVKILSWAVDIDVGTIEEQFEIIKRALPPSRVVRSKNGFHVYYDAEDGSIENWQDIVEFRLIPYFNGDLKAKDWARILRKPGYLHQKNLDDPFLVMEVMNTGITYTAADMARCFPNKKKEISTKMMNRHLGGSGNTLSDRIYNLDCIEALSRLSGTALVGGEVYTFRRNGNGTHNILVNGKSTSCFVDQQGRIGAIPGGPTIWTWLRFFNHKDQDIAKYLRDYFPEIWKGL